MHPSQATSQYWDTFARMAFPCLDEPNIKAQFIITLATKGYGRCFLNFIHASRLHLTKSIISEIEKFFI